MSQHNPTPLRIGMSGRLNGWHSRVTGRVVLSMEDGGETYYWNEFNLDDGFGVCATLVYEETENGFEWKLFKPFEPLRPLTAMEASFKRVGQMVELDGIPTRISLVDQSRVCHIEGVAPAGVELGDVANYFNAETGGRMLVASWTGDEIEFFEGKTVSAESVAAAFGLQPEATGFRSTETSFNRETGQTGSIKVVGVALTLFALFGVFSCVSGNAGTRRSAAPAPPAPRAAPPLQLATGTRGTLGGHDYLVSGRAVQAIGTVRGRYDRREYDLLDDAGQHALLLQGLTGGAKEWHLFTPVDVPAGFSAFEAAAQRSGATVRFGDASAQVADLFQASTLSVEGAEARSRWPAGIRYGFIARVGGDAWFIARWDETGIWLHRGRKLTEPEVLAGLGQKGERAQ